MTGIINLNSDPVQYLSNIDICETDLSGAETYKPGTVVYGLASYLNWGYTFKNSNVLFKKQSLQEFLSRNLNEEIDIDVLTEIEIREKISKIDDISNIRKEKAIERIEQIRRSAREQMPVSVEQRVAPVIRFEMDAATIAAFRIEKKEEQILPDTGQVDDFQSQSSQTTDEPSDVVDLPVCVEEYDAPLDVNSNTIIAT